MILADVLHQQTDVRPTVLKTHQIVFQPKFAIVSGFKLTESNILEGDSTILVTTVLKTLTTMALSISASSPSSSTFTLNRVAYPPEGSSPWYFFQGSETSG